MTGVEKKGGAPEVSTQAGLNVRLGDWLAFLAMRAEQRIHGHDKAGGAETALGAVRLCEALLDGMQSVARVPDS